MPIPGDGYALDVGAWIDIMYECVVDNEE